MTTIGFIGAGQLGEPMVLRLLAAGHLGVAPDALLSALAVCSGDSNVAAHVPGVGGLTAFVDRATPFLRKDVSAAIAAAQSVGSDLGFLQSVVIDGPLDLT